MQRVRKASAFNLPGSSFSRRPSGDSVGAFLVHCSCSSGYRCVKLRGRVLEIYQRQANQGPKTRVFATLRLKFSGPGESPVTRDLRRARAPSRSPHFRRKPRTPTWVTCTPPFFVSLGQAVCGLSGETPGGLAVSNEWWLVDKATWGISQTSTLWQLDEHPLDATEWGEYPPVAGSPFARTYSPALDSHCFAA